MPPQTAIHHCTISIYALLLLASPDPQGNYYPRNPPPPVEQSKTTTQQITQQSHHQRQREVHGEMARPLHRPSLLLPTCVLMLLAAAGVVAATAGEAPERKVRMTVRYADEEEARWLDRWAQTRRPLCSGGGGRLTLTRATEEESAWLNRNRLAGAAKAAREEAHAGAAAGGGRGDDGFHHVEFDHDDPRGRVVQAFLSQLARLRQDLGKSQAQEQQEDTKEL